jgi:hypothetical protein
MQYDFRQVYTSVLEQWFGASETDRKDILMNSFESIPIIGDSEINGKDPAHFRVYPNPLGEMNTIEFTSAGQPVSIEAVDIQGRKAAHIFSGSLPAGKQVISWNATPLGAGYYIILLHAGAGSQTKIVIKL